MYNCNICGKTYESIDDYVKCVSECAQKKKVEQEKIRKEKLEKEKEVRLKELKELEELYNKKVEEYFLDYGSYTSSFSTPMSSLFKFLWL